MFVLSVLDRPPRSLERTVARTGSVTATNRQPTGQHWWPAKEKGCALPWEPKATWQEIAALHRACFMDSPGIGFEVLSAPRLYSIMKSDVGCARLHRRCSFCRFSEQATPWTFYLSCWPRESCLPLDLPQLTSGRSKPIILQCLAQSKWPAKTAN